MIHIDPTKEDLLSGFDTKGTAIMEAMLLEQYKGKPNINEYIKAYIAEMDELFWEIRQVEIGRYLNYASGRQLDIIGIILGQSRNVEIERNWFGFDPHINAKKMADEARPLDGGTFISEESVGWDVVPLDDNTYRNVLLLRGACSNSVSWDIDTVYKSIELLLDRVPKYIKLRRVGTKEVDLELQSTETTEGDVSTIYAFRQWFIPAGTSFKITLI